MIRWGQDQLTWTQQKFDISKIGQLIILKDKPPNTKFFFQVCFWGEKEQLSQWSEVKSTTTSEAIPTGEPQNLIVETKSDKVISVSWSPPAPEKRHGKITGYKLRYGSSKGPEGRWSTIQIADSVTTKVIENLEAYTVYEIKVHAENKKGFGPAATQSIRTKEGVPQQGHPPKVEHGKDSRSLVITLQKPTESELKGRLLRYVLKYENADTKEVKTKEVNTGNEKIELEDLQPFTQYHFKVQYENHDHVGDLSTATTITTGEELPLQAVQIKSVRSVTDDSFTKHSIDLSWEGLPRSKLLGKLKHYIIEWKSFKESDWEKKTTKEERVIIDNLQAWTIYKIRIAVVNGAGTGPYGEVSHKTDAGIPGKALPPELTPSSSSSITVKMKLPTDEAAEVGGELKCFKIRYMEAGKEPVIRPECVPAADAEYKLEGLKAHTTYNSKSVLTI